MHTTWNKQGGMEVIPATDRQRTDQAFILVAVWNNAPVRYLEYTSMKPFVISATAIWPILRDEPATGQLFTSDNLKGDLYLRFLVRNSSPTLTVIILPYPAERIRSSWVPVSAD